MRVFLWVVLAAAAAAAFTTVPSAMAARQRRLLASSPRGEDLSQLSRAELEALVVQLRQENSMLLLEQRKNRCGGGGGDLFDVLEASALGGYAFESYNAPQGARWERGADGCDVAFSSASFVRAAYAGAVVVRVLKARGLRRQQRDLTEVAMTGGKSDPYVAMAVVEASKGTLAERSGNATDVARTSTIWRGGSDVEWNENYTLFVRDLSLARLALTVMDEDVQDDDVLGAAEIPALASVLAKSPDGKWRGTLQLKADSESKVLDTGAGFAGAAVAAMAGVATAGVAAVAIGAAAAAAAANERRGTLEVEVEYFPFDTNEDVVALAPTLPVVPTAEPPTGATPGIDWTQFANPGASYEPLCFVDHRRTGTQAGIWRDEKRKRLLVSFRGTSEPRDVVTDASAAMTPWARDAKKQIDGYESVPAAAGDPRVHAGFRGALESIALRLKQLLVLAADGKSDWTLELTGHSLGGALATLFALEVAGGIDLGRSLPVRPALGQSWLVDVIGGGRTNANYYDNKMVDIASDVKLVTFGAPRTGDGAFARILENAVPSHFRVVNDQDIVARLPRGFAYAHGGQTVMVNDDDDTVVPLWVEGEDPGACPLKVNDDASSSSNGKRNAPVVSSPFAQGGALAELLDKALLDSDNSKDRSVPGSDDDDDEKAWNPFGTTIDTAVKLRDLAFDTITSPTQLAKLAGVDAEYAELELKLLAALSSGDAINHHLEPAYFSALERARTARRGETQLGGGSLEEDMPPARSA